MSARKRSHLELEPGELRDRVDGGVRQCQSGTRVPVNGGRYGGGPTGPMVGRPVRRTVGRDRAPRRPFGRPGQGGRGLCRTVVDGATDTGTGRRRRGGRRRRPVVVEAQRDQRAQDERDGQQSFGRSTAVHCRAVRVPSRRRAGPQHALPADGNDSGLAGKPFRQLPRRRTRNGRGDER